MSSLSRMVDVDIYDFDLDVILEAATEIRSNSPAAAAFAMEGERAFYAVSDLAAAISAGDRDSALHQLNRLVANDARLIEAVDLGKRRAR